MDECSAVELAGEDRPDGRLLHTALLGAIQVVTSTNGAVTAYAIPRDRVWQTVLPAPSRVAPVRVGQSLAVLDTRDHVIFLDLDTGEVRGELHLRGARALAATADTDTATARLAITDHVGLSLASRLELALSVTRWPSS